jgi:chromosome segregation ATPase
MEAEFKRLSDKLDQILAQLTQLKSENQKLKRQIEEWEAKRVEILKRIELLIDRLGMGI